jgi:hypothetical protein
MAKYRFFKKNKYSRKVEIRRERVEFDPGALFVCLVAAILVWLYVAGTYLNNAEQPPLTTEPAETEQATADEPDTGTGDEAPAAQADVGEGHGDTTEPIIGD